MQIRADRSANTPISTGVRVLLLAIFLGLAFVAGPSSTFAFEGQEGSTGLHDDAGVFSDDERDRIEAAIANVEATGAPTVVYLRLLFTEEDRAVRDGQRLMEAWEVESEPGARDGIVIFFNLNPDDPNRGEFGIVAGETHFDGGALPQSELNRIRDDMIPLLRDDQMADAIVLGLERTAERIEAGPPEPTRLERILDPIASGPISLLNVIGLIGAVVFASRGWRLWRDRPHAEHSDIHRTTEPPGSLHPALAGALVQTRIDQSQVEATILELAKHKAIAFEPDPDDPEKVQIRILDRANGANEFEFQLIDAMSESATDNVLDQKALGETRNKWGEIQTHMREDLQSIGWFDPDVSSKKWPFYMLGILAVPLGTLFLAPLIILDEPWLLVGGGALLLTGIVIATVGASYPETTPEGEEQAVQWRGYREGLRRAADSNYGTINLDEAFPFIVAFGLPNQYKKHFEEANERGYVPAWLGVHDHSHPMAGHWFIYWNSFHRSVNPEPSSSGGSVGGAAGGSGGAGGRF